MHGGVFFQITLHDGKDKKPIQDQIKEIGGTITHDYTIINAFAATIPDDTVTTFEENKDVKHVEKDGEVRTQ
ncbi:hypothetical protein AA313_de0207912 [Arthrobotrys entomopaga]|nr:hypothetical protein AA313_de0207912 [Arthrobotrys entomopaga]